MLLALRVLNAWIIIAVITATFLLASYISPAVSAQNLQDFHFSSFNGTYELARDEEDRSRLRITEKLVAEFPDHNQNKGIVRHLPITLNGRPLSFELESISRNGQTEPIYEQSRENGMVSISTGTDEYIQGTQEFQIIYTYRDVTLDFGEYQELFWNTNGTEWRQRFDEVTATVLIDVDLQEAFTGEVVCFEGPEGSQNSCNIQEVDDETVLFTTTRPLSTGENMSFALKFEPNTFASYQESTWSSVVRIGVALGAFIASTAGLYSMTRIYRKHRDRKPGEIIPREYLPIKDMPILKAAIIYNKQSAKTKAVTAQILELAVQRKINLLETEKSGFLGRKTTKYELEVTDTNNFTDEQQHLLKLLLKHTPETGMRHTLSKSDAKIATTLHKYQETLQKQIVADGYREPRPRTWPQLLLALAGVGFAITFAAYSTSIGFIFDFVDLRFWSLPLAGIFGLVTMVMIAQPLKRPTETGREVINHIKGLDEYIKLAEAERLQFHQSPEGARKQRIDPDNKEEVVRLYERLLPYAVILGHEKQWFKVIGNYYEEINQRPVWYVGSGSFSASHFTSAMHTISTTATSSSGSGFSGGGGSGGGGGGGGGGGR